MEKKKLFYGWYVVLSSFFIMGGAFVLLTSLHSLFMIPVTEEIGMSRGAFSLVFSITAIGIALASPIMGKLLVTKSMKLIMAICVVGAGLCFIAYSFGQSAFYFYVVAFILGICIAGFANIPISIMITNWFQEKKGTAMGIAFAGTGIGSAALSPLLTYLIQSAGWRTAYIAAGLLAIGITLPFILLFVSKSPAEKGLVALGAKTSVQNETKVELSGLTLKQIQYTPMFWLFVFGMLCFALVIGGLQMHIPAYLMDIGHTALFASTIFGILSISNTVGKLIFGPVLDKFGTVGGCIYVGICMVTAIAALLFAKVMPLAFVFAIAYGFSVVVSTIAPSFMTGDIFGRKDFGAIFGMLQIFCVGGSSVGVVLSGVIYDMTQSYKMAWLIFLGLFITGVICTMIAYSLKDKVIKQFEKQQVTEMKGLGEKL